MESEWKRTRIEDVAEKVAMGPFGSSIKVSTFVSDGVPIISGQHLNDSRLSEDKGFKYISFDHADRLKNSNAQRGDVIFTHAGNIGQVSYIPKNSLYERYVISQRQFLLRPKLEKVIPEYLVAYFKSPVGQHQILANASQVGVPAIAKPVSYLRTIKVPIPPLPEQRAIAQILGALDDKIELNRRMNETLEAMARALFKSWFVDFEPVRAKMDGRDTGLPPHIAALFPDRLVPSELGEIPAGWEVTSLSEIATAPSRSIDPNHIRKDTPYIGLQHMPRRSISLEKWEYSEMVSSNKSVFRKGEFLFGKLRPYFHKVGIAPLNGISSTDIVVIAPKCEFYSSFVLSLISSDVFVSYTDQTSTGTKMPRTSWKTMGRFPVCTPDRTVFQEFEAVICSNFERIIENVHENRTLAAMRDALLPKLMSGELRVNDAEAFLEKC